MRYLKFVINGVENVKSFKNSDSPPQRSVYSNTVSIRLKYLNVRTKKSIVSGVEERINTPTLYHGL